MNIVLFGATGMIGQAVLLECFDDPRVDQVLTVGRRPTGKQHGKLVELVHGDFTDFGPVEDQLSGVDACIWCLGIGSAGMSEADYRRITVDYAVAASEALLRRNPGMVMCFVSGTGTDSSGTSRQMWARVKGDAENALLAMPFGRAHMFRPAFIQPRRGVVSGTRLYRVFYAVLGPFFPVLKALFPKQVTTSDEVGRALIQAAVAPGAAPVLENHDITALVA